jgi:hypothetical protein
MIDADSNSPRFVAARQAVSEAGLTAHSIFKTAVTDENRLGNGSNGTGYAIPKLDNYVLKMMDWGGRAEVPVGSELHPVVDLFPEGNIGQAVASLGDTKGRATLLLKQHGQPSGGPRWREAEVMGKEAAYDKYLGHLQTAADMPQHAYDQFASSLQRLRERGLAFDNSKANNLLVDAKAQQFNIIDVNPAPYYYPTASQMTDVLIDPAFANNTAIRKPPRDLTQTIVAKIISAAERANLQIDAHIFKENITGMHAQADAMRSRLASEYAKSRPEIFKRMESEARQLTQPLQVHKAPADVSVPPWDKPPSDDIR